MGRLKNTRLLFLIIALEGFIILSAELLAMRQTIPFVGSGTDTFSIIIAAVLMPLALGYHAGGHYRLRSPSGHYRTIRKKLLMNVTIAAAFLLPGLSYFLIQFFFFGLHSIGIENNIINVSLYCLIFLVTPTYLLGQTIPLVSHYFSKEKLSHITGRMLFVSTIGSFCGSILTTLFFMATIGVHNTVTLLFCLLFSLVLILTKKQTRHITMTMLMILGVCAVFNSNHAMNIINIVKNNKYSTIIIDIKDDGSRHLQINSSDSSKYSDSGEKHEYVEFAERLVLDSIPADATAKDVLVIGAGGFTFGHNDEKNNFIYIDIDKDLKQVSELYLLREKLKPNKIFYPLPARAYLASTDKKFDLILLDAYLGALSLPEHLVTQEFFTAVKMHLKDEGILLANFIVSSNFKNSFSKNIDNTVRSVFPYISRHDTHGEYNLWSESATQSSNLMYIYKNHKNFEKREILPETVYDEKVE